MGSSFREWRRGDAAVLTQNPAGDAAFKVS